MRPISTSDFARSEALDIDPALLSLVGAQLADALGDTQEDEPAMLEKLTAGSLLTIGALAIVAWAPVAAGIVWLV